MQSFELWNELYILILGDFCIWVEVVLSLHKFVDIYTESYNLAV